MDWRSIRFDWNRARAFLVTAEEGSFSAAARALGTARPTLGRQVTALEEELGVVLFERSARGLSLTPAGQELVEHVRRMGDAASRLSLTASGQSQATEGVVCVSASEAVAALVLPSIALNLRRQFPAVTLEVVASNAMSNLRRREADIAIRNIRPSDPDLIGRKLADATAKLYASTDYIARFGPFDDHDALARADFIGFEENAEFLAGLNAHGVEIEPMNFKVVSGSHLVHWEMVKHGLGVGVMATLVGDQEPVVRPAAPWLAPFVFPIWLVAHREVNTSRRIRLVFDALAEEIAALGFSSR